MLQIVLLGEVKTNSELVCLGTGMGVTFSAEGKAQVLLMLVFEVAQHFDELLDLPVNQSDWNESDELL